MLFEQLRDDGYEVTGVARSSRGIEAQDGKAKFIELDATEADAIDPLIKDNTILIHCSKPEILTGCLLRDVRPARLIALGSTRIYTRYPDDKCSRVAAMSHAISMRDIPSTLLHPTMIYGAPGLSNIERVAKVARVSPIIPLPENGNALIQPVHASDVVAAVRACLERHETVGRTIAVPGPKAVTYREFIELCISLTSANCKVVSMPYFLISLLAPFTHVIPGIPGISHDEVQRLLEDKNFSTEDLVQILGVEPRDLESGLRASFS
jgi:nucleoside-diphosphate-sugar epimerase